MQFSIPVSLLLVCILITSSVLKSEILPTDLYKVKKGDSLYGIAKKNRISITELYQWNPDKKKNPVLFTGETIKLPSKSKNGRSSSANGKLASEFSYPLEKRISISQKFSSLTYNPNKGVFFQVSSSPVSVLASRGGKVVTIDYLDGYGNYIIVQHYGGYYSVYGNLGKITVNEGQTIHSGQGIGVTEKKAGLYFQISYQDRPIDPLPLILKG